MTDNSVSGRVRALVEPVLAAAGIELVDVEQHASILKVTVDRPGGVDLDVISAATRRISSELDRADPVAGRYLLEVSSPGLERPLRTPTHFEHAVGATVIVKVRPDAGPARAAESGKSARAAGSGKPVRRVEGVLESSDDEGVVVGGTQLSYSDIQSARTQFVWPTPKQSRRQKAGTP